MSIVPDAIEPYVGWKALVMRSDGRLASPQQKTVWPVKQRLEALCTAKSSELGWSLVRERDPITQGPPPAPQVLPPPGFVWSYEPQPHQVVAQDCRCGIYAVSDIKEAAKYLQPGALLAEIALWGRVVPAASGARGQFAYPQNLYVTDLLADVGTLVAQLYQVPIGYRCSRTGKVLTYEQALENLEYFKLERQRQEEALRQSDRLVRPIFVPSGEMTVTTTTANTLSEQNAQYQAERPVRRNRLANNLAAILLSVVIISSVLVSAWMALLAIPLVLLLLHP